MPPHRADERLTRMLMLELFLAIAEQETDSDDFEKRSEHGQTSTQPQRTFASLRDGKRPRKRFFFPE